jgi:hypothetical protein
VKCAVCERTGLRVTTLAWVPAANGGELERRRVCGDCAAGALTIVLRKAAPECLHCREPAIVCAGHGGAAIESPTLIGNAIRKLRNMAKAYRGTAVAGVNGTHAVGRADGLEQAADILDAGDF